MYDHSYSVLSDDGRARVAVGEMVKKQKLLLPGGRFPPSFDSSDTFGDLIC